MVKQVDNVEIVLRGGAGGAGSGDNGAGDGNATPPG